MSDLNKNDLFNNPMVDSALKSMSHDQLRRYKELGEEMYSNVNHVDSKILNNLPPPLAESAAYIIEGLKSGLLPIDLDENEINIMEEAYGKNEWYIKFGYTKEDLPVPEEIKIEEGHFGIELVEDPNKELTMEELQAKLLELKEIVDSKKN